MFFVLEWSADYLNCRIFNKGAKKSKMKQEFIKHARIFLLSLSLLMSFILINAQDRITGKTFATRSEVIASHGMAATSQPLATMGAIDILKQGGNAIDAAIAANAMMALTEPTGCGPGGRLVAIVWDAKTSKLYGLNASGRSPLSLTLDYFIKNGSSKI